MSTKPLGDGLRGARVLVTRAAAQAGALTEPLAARGAVPLLCPTISIAPPADLEPLDAALRQAGRYDWLLFTSVNAVHAVRDRLAVLKLGPVSLAGPRVAAIGPGTAAALDGLGLGADVVPAQFVAESLFASLGDVAGKRFLLPRAVVARDVLPRSIRAAGGRVDVVSAYETHLPRGARAQLAALRAEGPFDAATFTSSSTVRHFVEVAGGAAEARAALEGAVVACIGPIAAKTAAEEGIPVDITAREHTIPGLLAALDEHFAKEKLA